MLHEPHLFSCVKVGLGFPITATTDLCSQCCLCEYTHDVTCGLEEERGELLFFYIVGL